MECSVEGGRWNGEHCVNGGRWTAERPGKCFIMAAGQTMVSVDGETTRIENGWWNEEPCMDISILVKSTWCEHVLHHRRSLLTSTMATTFNVIDLMMFGVSAYTPRLTPDQLLELSREHSPCYVYSETILRRQIAALRTLPVNRLFFAIKANPNPDILKARKQDRRLNDTDTLNDDTIGLPFATLM